MNFKPFDNFVLTTCISPDEVLERINSIHEPKRSRRWDWIERMFGNNIAPYEGNAWSDGFVINRVAGQRTRYMPKIKGQFFANDGITTVNVSVRLGTISIVLLIVELLVASFISLFTMAIFLHEITTPSFHYGSLLLFTPVVMFVIIYWLIIDSCKTELRESSRFLCELLEANEM